MTVRLGLIPRATPSPRGPLAGCSPCSCPPHWRRPVGRTGVTSFVEEFDSATTATRRDTAIWMTRWASCGCRRSPSWSQPRHARLRTTVEVPRHPRLVADGFEGSGSWNLSNATQPTLVGSYDRPTGVRRDRGGHPRLRAEGFNLRVLDIATPRPGGSSDDRAPGWRGASRWWGPTRSLPTASPACWS